MKDSRDSSMRLWRVESYAQDVVTKLSRWLLSKERRKTFDFENHMAWLSSLFFSAVSDKNTKNGKK